MAWGVVMMLLTNLFQIGLPMFTGWAIDALVGRQKSATATAVTDWITGAVGLDPHHDSERALALCISLVVLAVAFAATRIWSRVWIFNAARAAEYDLRSELFGHMMKQSPAYYREHPVGDVMSRLTNDVQTIRAVWGFGLVSSTNAVLTFVLTLAAMLSKDWVVTLWAFVPFPLIYIVGRSISRRIFGTMRLVQGQLGALSSRIQEDLGAIHVIKTYGLERLRRVGFIEGSNQLLASNMDAAKVRIQLGPILSALAALGMAILLLFGGRAVARGDMSEGDLVAFSGFIGGLVGPTLMLGFLLALIQRGRASWVRLAELLRAQPDIPDGAGPPLAHSSSPAHVELRGLTVKVGDRTLLDDVRLDLPPGTITAVVGRTGAGKSTLVDALCRLTNVPPGTLFIDGRDVTELPLASLRAQIGYAPQEAFLFSTTIADNIAMGYGGGTAIPTARVRELERVGAAAQAQDLRAEPRVTGAAEAAGLTRDLAAMPEGLGTIVGERGITLSGGQRQRVALARALAAAPRLLVLDDSLSSVDADTERLILKHLRTLMHGRTVVLISHRVAAIKYADQIAVIDQGKIVARGTHEELLAAGGVYSDLYRAQLDTELDKPQPPQEEAP